MSVETIDIEKCIGCAAFVETCSMEVFRLHEKTGRLKSDLFGKSS